MNKKGFTLIELLAVIIILGILMIIAIPSVTKYISDSRKNAYIDTAKEIVGGTRNVVNEGKLGMYDTNTTYYIPSSYIQTENASKSPYGDFVQAYVGVVYDGTGYKYYWISADDAGQGIVEVTPVDKLDIDDIKSDLNPDDILSTIKTTGVGNRSDIRILENGTWSDTYHADNKISEEGGSVIYPTGKTKETVTAGDKVIIGTEEFYVVRHDGSNLVLLTHYNLKVGSIYGPAYSKIGEYSKNDDGYGKQDSEMIGRTTTDYNTAISKGSVAFSNTNYWKDKVGDGLKYPGKYCLNSSTNGCADVFDDNSYLKQYVDSYKIIIEKYGVTVKEARLLSYNELYEFGCNRTSCNSVPAFFKETRYWLSSPYNDLITLYMGISGSLNDYSCSNDFGCGVRPVIVI